MFLSKMIYQETLTVISRISCNHNMKNSDLKTLLGRLDGIYTNAVTEDIFDTELTERLIYQDAVEFFTKHALSVLIEVNEGSREKRKSASFVDCYLVVLANNHVASTGDNAIICSYDRSLPAGDYQLYPEE